MRMLSAICVLLALAASATAAERAWRNGTWAQRTSSGAYAIETRTDVITGESGSGETLTATSGTAVQFAIEGQTLYIRDGNSEHSLKLTGSGPKYSKNYTAVGSGHFIKSVAPGGAQVTLEDGSRWDIDSRQYFAVAGWQPDDLISIRREEGDPDFSFEIDNTTQDDGSLANFRVR
jgi:hypothetical protein